MPLVSTEKKTDRIMKRMAVINTTVIKVALQIFIKPHSGKTVDNKYLISK